jgi:signal peptidase
MTSMGWKMKWISNSFTCLLGFLLLITLFFATSSKLSGGTPKLFGLQMFAVLSGSMEPHIHTGSVIFTKPNVPVDQLHVGDVITFKPTETPDILITHRIQEINSTSGVLEFVTKGDANDSADPSPISATNVIAQYSNITIPYLGYYFEFLKTKLGLSLLLIIPGLLLILSAVIGLFREIMKLEKAAKSKETTVIS